MSGIQTSRPRGRSTCRVCVGGAVGWGTMVCPTIVIFWELLSTRDKVALPKKGLKDLLASHINSKEIVTITVPGLHHLSFSLFEHEIAVFICFLYLSN